MGETPSRRRCFRRAAAASVGGVVGHLVVADAAQAPARGRPFDSLTLAQGRQGGASQLPAPATGPQIDTRIGVRPFINLTGTLTINGRALMLPEAREACHQAADHAVDIDELMEKAGARIAELIGCGAAIVTSGAAAALSHATAACIVGTDPELMAPSPAPSTAILCSCAAACLARARS